MKTNKNNIIALAMSTAIALSLTGGLHAATKTLTMGDSKFGATVTATMSYLAPANTGTCELYTAVKAEGKVLSRSATLGSGNANFRLREGSRSARAWGNLKLGSTTIAQWDKTTTGSQTFSTEPFTIAQIGGKATYWGLVNVQASASIKMYAEGHVTVTSSSGGKPAVSVWLGPVLDVSATGGADILGLAGVEGSITLFKGSLVGSAQMKPSTDVREPNTSIVNYNLFFSLQALRGRLWVWADLPLLGYHSADIASYNGLNKTYSLASGSFKLRAAPMVLVQ